MEKFDATSLETQDDTKCDFLCPVGAAIVARLSSARLILKRLWVKFPPHCLHSNVLLSKCQSYKWSTRLCLRAGEFKSFLKAHVVTSAFKAV